MPEVKDSLRWEFERNVARLSDRLEGPFLMGDMMTVPDIVLAHCLNWAYSAKFAYEQENLLAYAKAMRDVMRSSARWEPEDAKGQGMGTQYFVIGSGSIGRRHYDNLQSLGAEVHLLGWRGLELAALERMIGKAEQAAVVIATATQVRMELIALCGRLGIPFYVEKPLAFRMEDLQRIFAAAEPVAHRSMVGFMMRYHPALRALVDEPIKAFGFHLEIGHDVRQWRQNWRFGDSYAAQPEGGGVLLDLCHEVDIAHCLFPKAVLQGVDSIGHDAFPNVDIATRVTLSEAGGPVGTVAMDYLSPKSLRRMNLRGREEVLDLDWLVPRWVRTDGGAETVRDWDFERNDMFLAAMRDFMALVDGAKTSGNPLMPRFDRVYDSCALIAQAWENRVFRGTIAGGFE